MSESGFDVLNKFAPAGGGTITYAPYSPTAEQQNNVIDINQQAQKNQITDEIAAQDVKNTNMFNYYANMYAGQFLPVKAAQEAAMENYALQLGIGTRYTPEDFKAMIEESVGPIQDTTAGQKFTRFLVDSFNARTPYKGAAGALDVYLQALGKKFERDDIQKAAKLERRLMIGELAAKQAMDANENIKGVEADFYLKKMGYDNDTAKQYLGYSNDILQKIMGMNIDIEKDKIKNSLDMLKNPDKPMNIKYKKPDGTYSEPIMARTILTEFGPQIMMGRVVETEQGPIQVFDVPVPADADGQLSVVNVGTQNVGDNSKALDDNVLSPQKIQAGAQDIYALQSIKKDVGEILLGAKQDISTLGTPGAIKDALQETRFVTQSVLDLVGNNNGKGNIGTTLYQEGQTLYNFDKANFEEMLDTEGVIILNDKPKQIGPVKFGSSTERVNASIQDLFDESWWISQGYDKRYAQNKVREQFIVYGLARALKPTGRLNVDDVKRASDSVSLYGLQSPERVIAKLEEVYEKISDAQRGLIDSAPAILSTNPNIEDVENLLRDLGYRPEIYRNYFNKDAQQPNGAPVVSSAETITQEDIQTQGLPATSFSVDDLGFGM
jgi:hypothetical protein